MIYLTVLRNVKDDTETTKQASQRIKDRIQSDYQQQIVYDGARPTLTRDDFNVSHHFPVVVAIVDSQRVGIDVTYSHSPPHFTHDECTQLFTRVPKTEQEFLLLWALREACLKYTGEGFRETPLSIGPIPDPATLPELESSEFDPPTATVENHTLYCFKIRGQISAAQCRLVALSQIVILA